MILGITILVCILFVAFFILKFVELNQTYYMKKRVEGSNDTSN